MSDGWLPDLSDTREPIYRAIADSIVEGLATRRLQPGMRMPTHRELASRLGVTVGTVTRAYAEARERGLISGEVGRGTFVNPVVQPEAAVDPGLVVDLMLNKPVAIDAGAFLRKSLIQIAESQSVTKLLDYPVAASSQAHRMAGAKLAALTGVEAGPDQIVVTNGAQQALVAALAAWARPGDVVATEALTYTGMRSIAGFLHLRLRPIAIDEGGMVPASLEEACRAERIAALVVTPSIHNPTTATLDLERRRAIVEIAARHGLPVIENDVYGPLVENHAPTLYSLAAGECAYICGVSKSVASGVRVGYVVAPLGRVAAALAAVHATTWTVAPLLAELVSQWMRDGTVERVIASHRVEIARRQELARAILGEAAFRCHPQSYHLWLDLPGHWRPQPFAEACRLNGVIVTPSTIFALEPDKAPNAVRLALGAQQNPESLRIGLTRVAHVLRSPPVSGLLMI